MPQNVGSGETIPSGRFFFAAHTLAEFGALAEVGGGPLAGGKLQPLPVSISERAVDRRIASAGVVKILGADIVTNGRLRGGLIDRGWHFFVCVASALCVGDVERVSERLCDCKLFLHEMCNIFSKSLRLQRFARYLFHAICAPQRLTP